MRHRDARYARQSAILAVRLFHHAQQRTPVLVGRGLGAGGRLVRNAPQHLVTQRPQIGVVDPLQPHPQIEDDNRKELSRLTTIVLAENLPALFKRSKDRMKSFV
jgi:hypothetical protein